MKNELPKLKGMLSPGDAAELSLPAISAPLNVAIADDVLVVPLPVVFVTHAE